MLSFYHVGSVSQTHALKLGLYLYLLRNLASHILFNCSCKRVELTMFFLSQKGNRCLGNLYHHTNTQTMMSNVHRLQSYYPTFVLPSHSKEFRLISGSGALLSQMVGTQQLQHSGQLEAWLFPEAFVSCKCSEFPSYLQRSFSSTFYFVLF